MKTYTIKQASDFLGVGTSTVRKYCLLLEARGYIIHRSENNSRIFHESNVLALQEMARRSLNGEKLDSVAEYIAINKDDYTEAKDVSLSISDSEVVLGLAKEVEKLTHKLADVVRESEENRKCFMLALRKIEEFYENQSYSSPEITKTQTYKPETKRSYFRKLFALNSK